MNTKIRNAGIVLVVLAALALAIALLTTRGATIEETTGESSTPAVTGPGATDPGTDATMPSSTEPAGHHDGDHAGHDHGGPMNGDGFALSAVQDGYLLAPLTEMIAAQTGATYQFRILGPDGAPVEDYAVVHEQKMHVLMVSQDLKSYAHVHPEMDSTGLWTIDYPFPQEGRWRIVADFQPADGPAMALGTWTVVGADRPGEPEDYSADARSSEVDGYTVTLTGDTAHDKPRPLTFTITRDGEPVSAVEPYLGANGHLVGFSADDYSYVHMHPNEGFADGQMTFTAPALNHGYWALFLQVKLGGELVTFPFVIYGE